MKKGTNATEKLALPARASVWYTLTGALERGSAMLFTPIITRMLSPEEFGIYPLYTSWMGVITIFTTLELTGGVIYRGLKKFKGKESEFICGAMGLMTLSFGLSLILYMIFADGLETLTGLSQNIIAVLIIQTYLNGTINLSLSKYRYFYKYKLQAFIALFSSIATPALSILLINLTRVRAESKIYAQLAVSIIIAIPILITAFYRGKALFFRNNWRFIISFSIPLIPHFIASSLIIQAGKIIVGKSLGEGALGSYSVAFSLGFIISILTGGIWSALSPWITRRLADKEYEKISATFSRIISPLFTAVLIFLSLAPELFSILAPFEYRDSLGAVYPIAISVLISFAANAEASALMFYEKTYLITASSIAAALLSISLNLFFIPRLGYLSAAAIQALIPLILLFLHRIALYALGKRGVIPLWEFVLKAGIFSFFAFLFFAVRTLAIARMLLFAALIIYSLPKLKECIDLIKEKGRSPKEAPSH